MVDIEILKREIGETLNRQSVNLQGRGKASAVLLPLFWKNGQCCLLLTKRAQEVGCHKGEISFPGGSRESIDKSLLNTALRETEEEVGIHANTVDVLGKLDDTLTIVSNFVISPYVGWIPYPYACHVNHCETEKLLEIPLVFFLCRERYWKGSFQFQGKAYQSHFYQWRKGEVVWGATGRIIHCFCELLHERISTKCLADEMKS